MDVLLWMDSKVLFFWMQVVWCEMSMDVCLWNGYANEWVNGCIFYENGCMIYENGYIYYTTHKILALIFLARIQLFCDMY